MAYNPGALESVLVAAVGEEPALINELRVAFLESAKMHVRAMERAVTLSDWQFSAMRLHSLAASFGARRIMDAAIASARTPYIDKPALQKITRAISALNA
jgi:histidine phosphotransfer protein HptB